MPKGFYSEVTKLLTKHGYYHHRTGKHQVWKHEKTNRTVIVAHNVDSIITANGILQQAGIDHVIGGRPKKKKKETKGKKKPTAQKSPPVHEPNPSGHSKPA